MQTRLFVGTVVLAGVIGTLPIIGARTEKSPAAQQTAIFSQKLTKDQEILHALNRLTFGPRPGDVEAVRKMGLKKWIDQQLHPHRITQNPVLAQRLAPLESLQMNNQQLVQNYPPPQYIMAVATGRAPMPDDPEKRELIERLATRYKKRLEKAKDADLQITPADRKPLNELLTREQIQTLRNGTSEERAAVLRSMPEDKLGDLAFSLPDGIRKGLFAVAPVDVRRKMLLYAAPQQVLAHDLAEAKIYRAVYSNRQLEEVLTDFWFNHFNVYLDKGADHYLVTSYERDAIRPYVLGSFKDLLEATAKSPAMLFYLDNWQSVAPNTPVRGPRVRPNANGKIGKKTSRGLNENYARELLELHTMGVDGGYSQKDIIEVARCFTGWTIRDPRRGAGFEFNPRVHDNGEKTVLSVKIPAGGGEEDGYKVLDILVHQPATARFVSKKLATRFVADNPPPALVDRMAATFSKTNGDLREVMKTMLDSKEFWSQGAYKAKVKSPLEMVASALRATNADVSFAFGLANKIADLGEPLYRKQEPTGYSNSGEEWVNSAALLARMNFALALTDNKLPGVKIDQHRFDGDMEDLARSILLTDLSAPTREAIDKGLADKKDASTIAGLIIGSPEFQRR
jgi:uncharacterized protein (DUF1800 family)